MTCTSQYFLMTVNLLFRSVLSDDLSQCMSQNCPVSVNMVRKLLLGHSLKVYTTDFVSMPSD